MLCFCLFCLLAPDGISLLVESLRFLNHVNMSSLASGSGESLRQRDPSRDKITSQPIKTLSSPYERVESAAHKCLRERIERLLPKDYFFLTSEEKKPSNSTAGIPDESLHGFALVPFDKFLHIPEESRLMHIAETLRNGDTAYLQILRSDYVGIVARLVCFGNGLEMDARNLNILSFLPMEQLTRELNCVEDQILRIFQPDDLLRAVVLPSDIPRRNLLVSVNPKLSQSLHLGKVSASELPEFIRLFAEEGDNYEEFLHKSQAFLNPCSADNLLKYFDIEYYVNSFDPMLRERLDAYQIKEGIPLRQAITNELEVQHTPSDGKKSKYGSAHSEDDDQQSSSTSSCSRCSDSQSRRCSSSSDKDRRRSLSSSTAGRRKRKKHGRCSDSAHSGSHSGSSLSSIDASSSRSHESSSSSSSSSSSYSSSSSSSSSSSTTTVEPCTSRTVSISGPPPVEPWSDLKRHHDQPLVRRGNQFPSRAGYVRNADRYARWTERAQLNGLNRSSVVNRGKSTTSIRSGDASETSSRSDTVRKDDQQSVNRKRIALAQQLNEMENFISKLKAKASSNT
ncbi:hypothetical protein M514_26169, partial [Trichuris suis]